MQRLVSLEEETMNNSITTLPEIWRIRYSLFDGFNLAVAQQDAVCLKMTSRSCMLTFRSERVCVHVDTAS